MELNTGLTEEEVLQKLRDTPWQFGNNSPKPICLIKWDLRELEPSPDLASLQQLMADRMPDYHVFVIPNQVVDRHIDALEFEVFYPKAFNEKQFQELKELILADIEAMKTNHQSK